MGYDNYGIDWSVWGCEPHKPQQEEPAPLKSLPDRDKQNDSGRKKIEQEESEEIVLLECSSPKKITCILKNARFLPDEATDFNKLCDIEVDVEGEASGPVCFALWATYKGTEYDLHAEQTAFEKEGKARVALKLFYVDQYYDDVNCNGDVGAEVEYYAIITNKAARECRSEVLKMPINSETRPVGIKLFEYKSINDPLALSPAHGRVTLVNEKWVYVFEKCDSGITLVYECKPEAQGMNQSFEFVSWEDDCIETNRNTYPRQPLRGGSEEGLFLQPDKEYFILLSEIQLPVARIDYYMQQQDALMKRTTHILPDTLKADTVPVNVYLADYIELAYYLRIKYDECVGDNELFFSNKDRAQRTYLAGLVCEIARAKPRLKGWLDYGAVVKERNEHDRDVTQRLQKKEKAEKNLRDWKRSAGYILTRDDYAGTQEIEEQMLEHETALTTLDEIKYLEAEGEDKNSWLNTIFEPEGRFIFFRKLEALAANKDFWDLFGKYIVAKYLANFGPTKIKGVLTIEVQTHRIERFLDEIHEITERAKLKFPDLVKNNGCWFIVTIDHETKIPFIDYDFKGAGQVSGITHLDTKNYRPVKRKWNALRKHIDTAAPGFQKVLVAIETVNLGNSVYTLLKADTLKDKGFGFVNFAGSAADFLASFEHIGGKQKAAKFFSQQGYSYKTAKLRAVRSFAVINLAGAVCDYIGALKGTAEASSEDKNGIAAGWAVIGLASVISGTSAAMTIGVTSAQLAGAEVSAAFVSAFGLSSAALGVIGIGLFVVGGGILWLFQDSDFHEWAKKSLWSNESQKPDFVERQIQTLHELICEFTADSYLYENRMPGTEVITATGNVMHKLEYLFTLQVRPGYYSEEKSRYFVKLKIIREGGLFGMDATILDKEIMLAGSNAQRVSNLRGDETRTVLLRRFTGAELGLSGHYQHDTFKYSLTGYLDFYGDGSQLLFNIHKEGKLEMRSRDV